MSWGVVIFDWGNVAQATGASGMHDVNKHCVQLHVQTTSVFQVGNAEVALSEIC